MDDYKRDFSFADSKDEARNRQKLDQELDQVGNILKGMKSLINQSFNDDGSLKPSIIDGKAISKSIVLLPEEAAPWTAGVFYKIGSVVYVDSSIRWANKAHVSNVFEKETDLWEKVIDFKPFFETLERLAGNARVARVSANVESIKAVAEKMPHLLELHKALPDLKKLEGISEVLQFLAGDGMEKINAVSKGLGVIEEVSGSLEQIRKVSVSLNKIDAAASIERELSAIEKSLDDVKIVAAFVKQLKSIAAGVGDAAA